MKFAKKFQEELHQEWYDKYLDYRTMKKLLKLGNPDVMSAFCKLFESQLLKVQEFMQARQAVIREGIGPLEKVNPLRVPADWCQLEEVSLRPETLDRHCQQLVQDIEHFKGYASLNAVAMRKIIKKFDKRFQMRFIQHFGLPSASSKLVTEHDIGAWLLDPAQHCLRLMRSLVGGPAERPLRQFGFWVQELKAGALLAELRISSTQSVNPTALRLQPSGSSQEFEWCIKNTFIDCSQQSSSTPRRARSQPLRSVSGEQEEGCCSEDMDDLEILPVLRLEKWICQAVRIVQPSLDLEGCCTSPFASFPAPQSSNPSGPVVEDSAELSLNAFPPAQSQGAPPGCVGSGRAISRRSRQVRSRRAVPMRAQEALRPPARWWEAVEDVCPVSGFPVRLLPYPPFKLQQHSADSKASGRLIDGPFLALQILCTWCFECLGRPLTTAEVIALDAHMKRCKLGPLRLGRALELLGMGTSEAFHELRSMREKAKTRLDHVRHIQRMRMQGKRGSRGNSCNGSSLRHRSGAIRGRGPSEQA